MAPLLYLIAVLCAKMENCLIQHENYLAKQEEKVPTKVKQENYRKANNTHTCIAAYQTPLTPSPELFVILFVHFKQFVFAPVGCHRLRRPQMRMHVTRLLLLLCLGLVLAPCLNEFRSPEKALFRLFCSFGCRNSNHRRHRIIGTPHTKGQTE